MLAAATFVGDRTMASPSLAGVAAVLYTDQHSELSSYATA